MEDEHSKGEGEGDHSPQELLALSPFLMLDDPSRLRSLLSAVADPTIEVAPDVYRAFLRDLLLIVSEDTHIGELLNAGAVSACVRLLSVRPASTAIPYYATAVLGVLSASDRGARDLVTANGLPPLVALSKGNLSFLERLEAVQPLAHVARVNDELRAVLVSEGALRPLLELAELACEITAVSVRWTRGDADTDSALEPYQAEILTGGFGDTETEVEAAFLGGRVAQITATQSLCDMAGSREVFLVDALIQAEIPLGFMRLGRCPIPEVRELAAQGLAQLSAHESVLAVLGMHDAVEELVQVLSVNSREEVTRHLAGCVANIADSVQNTRMLAVGGVLHHLVQLAWGDDQLARKAAVLALANISNQSDDDIKENVVAAGAVMPLAAALLSHDPDDQRYAGQAIASITSCGRLCGDVISSGILPKVVSLMRSPWPDVQLWATTIMSNILNQEKCFSKLGKTGLLPLLTHLIHSCHVEIVHESLRALVVYCEEDEEDETIVDMGFLDRIAQLLDNEDSRLRVFAARVISALGTTEEYRLQLIQAGSVRPLIRMTRQPDPSSLRESLKALAVLDNFARLKARVDVPFDVALLFDERRSSVGIDHISTHHKDLLSLVYGGLSSGLDSGLDRASEAAIKNRMIRARKYRAEGECHLRGCRYTRGLESFTKALEYAPAQMDTAPLYALRSVCNTKMRHLHGTLSDSTRAIIMQGPTELMLMERANAYLALGKLQESVQDLKACLALPVGRKTGAKSLLAKLEGAQDECGSQEQQKHTRSASVLSDNASVSVTIRVAILSKFMEPEAFRRVIAGGAGDLVQEEETGAVNDGGEEEQDIGEGNTSEGSL